MVMMFTYFTTKRDPIIAPLNSENVRKISLWFGLILLGWERENQKTINSTLFSMPYFFSFSYSQQNMLGGEIDWHCADHMFCAVNNSRLEVTKMLVETAQQLSWSATISSMHCFIHQYCRSTSWMRVQHEISHILPLSHSPQNFHKRILSAKWCEKIFKIMICLPKHWVCVCVWFIMYSQFNTNKSHPIHRVH